jgi:hypothetical protein
MKNNWYHSIIFIRDRWALRKALQPDKTSQKNSKQVFLETFSEKFIRPVTIEGRKRITLRVVQWRYVILTISTIVAVNIGTAIFADAANVPFDHPLYAYKRLNESVRTYISSAQGAPDIHTQLAKRRLSEMQSVVAESSISRESSSLSKDSNLKDGKASVASGDSLTEIEKKIQRLNHDLQQEVDSTLEKSRTTEKDEAEQKVICDKIQDILEEHDKLVLSRHAPELNLNIFQKYCQTVEKSQKQ